MAKGDQFLAAEIGPKILAAKVVWGTNYCAKISLARPILGGTDFKMTAIGSYIAT